MKPRSTILRPEILEDRCTPTTFGNPWPDASHLTLSFVPDGTQVGSQQSSLFKTLKSEVSVDSRAWETEILRAFQTWAVKANLNVGFVADGGQPLGSPGLFQGDSRFGDIRVAGIPLSRNVLALSQPFDV